MCESGNNRDYFLINAHGDVTAKVSGGTVTKTYNYDAYGVEKNPDANDTNPFRYCGEYFDKESGSIYLRNRYYSPLSSRFITADTHWNPNNMIYGDKNTGTPDVAAIMQSGNLYVYCGGNPVSRIDLTGNEWGMLTEFLYGLNYLYGGLKMNTGVTDSGVGYVAPYVGSSYLWAEGVFFYDGTYIKNYPNGQKTIAANARNVDGHLMMERTDFYMAMGVSYYQAEQTFTVTLAGNIIEGAIVGLTASFLGAGKIGGTIAGVLTALMQNNPGEYKTIVTSTYFYSEALRGYETWSTYEVYWKAPGYDTYAVEPISVVSMPLFIAAD